MDKRIIVLKKQDDEVCFVPVDTDVTVDIFKEYKVIGRVTDERRGEIVDAINSCEWDKKATLNDFTLEIEKVDRYSESEKFEIENEKIANKIVYLKNRIIYLVGKLEILEKNGFAGDKEYCELQAELEFCRSRYMLLNHELALRMDKTITK